jgi:hypothetical protein
VDVWEPTASLAPSREETIVVGSTGILWYR